jgi:nucleoside-diphosphate-sugar epimerase
MDNQHTQERLLVVGGTGFIGRHLVQYASNQGFAVTSVSLSERVQMPHFPDVHYVRADISNEEQLKQTLGDASFEYVVNSGGYIHHASILDGGRSAVDAHFSGTLNLVEVINKSVLKAFVNLGSSDEYGGHPAPQKEVLREAPISPYALGKLASSQLLQMLYKTEGFPGITLRPFLVYGPHQDNMRFLPQIIQACLDGRVFPVSEGSQLRDFCFIDDMVKGVFAALSTPAARGEIINLASGRAVSIRSVIEKIQSLIGSGEPVYGEVPYRAGENMALYADITKARNLLGWLPCTTLEDGLQRTIASYRDRHEK